MVETMAHFHPIVNAEIVPLKKHQKSLKYQNTWQGELHGIALNLDKFLKQQEK